MTSEFDEAARDRLVAERERLQSLERELRDGLSSQTEAQSLEELSDNDQHPAEVATETFNRERDLGLVDTIAGELDDVDAALRRLDDGTYGTCTACGKPISRDRLDALPATPYCIDDAALAESEAARKGTTATAE